jgi:hypothetical protein
LEFHIKLGAGTTSSGIFRVREPNAEPTPDGLKVGRRGGHDPKLNPVNLRAKLVAGIIGQLDSVIANNV